LKEGAPADQLQPKWKPLSSDLSHVHGWQSAGHRQLDSPS
jgi:hypothetical protein